LAWPDAYGLNLTMMDALQLHQDAVVVDCHNDIPMSLALPELNGDRSTL